MQRLDIAVVRVRHARGASVTQLLRELDCALLLIAHGNDMPSTDGLGDGLGERRMSDDVAAHVITQYDLADCSTTIDDINYSPSLEPVGSPSHRQGALPRVYVLMAFTP